MIPCPICHHTGEHLVWCKDLRTMPPDTPDKATGLQCQLHELLDDEPWPLTMMALAGFITEIDDGEPGFAGWLQSMIAMYLDIRKEMNEEEHAGTD